MPINRSALFTHPAHYLVGAIAIVALVVMGQVSVQESAIMDELAHIPAGYSYVRELDHRINPEHPPLTKMLAGLPLLALDLNFPTDHKAWTTDVNGQWDMGGQLLYHSGNDADQIVRVARLGPMILTLILIILVYVWAAELIGRAWAVVPTALFAFSPNILAHGHYVTTDIAAALGVVLATYYFVHYLLTPSRGSIFKAGLAFGIAQAGKFSAVLLVPFFVFLVIVFVMNDLHRRLAGSTWTGRLRYGLRMLLVKTGGLIAIWIIGYALVIYPLYFAFTRNYPVARQVSDTTTILQSFANGPTPTGEWCRPVRCLADLNIWMAGNGIFRPFAEYFLGVLMVLQRAAGGNTNYFLGQVSAAGWHYYFPVVYLLKEPLPVVIMVLVALVASLWGILRILRRGIRASWDTFQDYLGTHFAEFAMITFVIFYWAYSIRSPLNIGFRHLFPTLPFIYILTASFWKRYVTGFAMPAETSFWATLWHGFTTVVSSSLKYLVFIVLVLWALIESVMAYPHYLSYFNQVGGGVENGYRYVTDSNYDWGQDLLRLKNFVAAHPEIDRIGVDYFGGGNPKYYLGDKEENWWSARGNPTNEGIHWLAVSVNTLQGATQKTVPGQVRKPEDEYRWLTALRPAAAEFGAVPEPDYRVGMSIFVYKL